jgi:hypothetical protein
LFNKIQDRLRQDQLGVITIALPITKIGRRLDLLRLIIHLLIMIEAGDKALLLQHQIGVLGAMAILVTPILEEDKALGVILVNLLGVMIAASEILVLETGLIQVEVVEVEVVVLAVVEVVVVAEEEEETS